MAAPGDLDGYLQQGGKRRDIKEAMRELIMAQLTDHQSFAADNSERESSARGEQAEAQRRDAQELFFPEEHRKRLALETAEHVSREIFQLRQAERCIEMDRAAKEAASRRARDEAMRPVREAAAQQAKVEETERTLREHEMKELAAREASVKAGSERLSALAAEKKLRFEQPSTLPSHERAQVPEKCALEEAALLPTVAATVASGRQGGDGHPGGAVNELNMSSVDVASFGLSRQHYDVLGGKKGLESIANDFYFRGMYESPIMQRLFAIRDDAHPKKLVLFLMHLMQVDDTYMKLRDHSYYAVKVLHENARHNPDRDRCPAGAGTSGGHWTVSQRDEWKGLFLRACTRNKVPAETVEEIGQFVDRVMQFYGPFVADRT